MTQTAYGERAYDKYIKHPAYSSTNPLSDGWAVDAGSAMLLHSNAHHLAKESYRQLVATTGRTLYSWKNLADLWDGFTDVEPAIESTPSSGARSLPWSSDETGHAMRFGPFPLVFDRLSSGQWLARKIRVRCLVQMTSLPAGTATLYYALSPVTHTPRGVCFAIEQDTLDTGAAYYTADLSPNSPAIRAWSSLWPCRGSTSSSVGSAYVSAVWAYLWIGWRLINGTTSPVTAGYLDAVSAWEIP